MRNRLFFLYASAILLFTLFVSPTLVAEGGRAPQEAKGTGLVTVEFRAIGDTGAPILDLKPADVALKVGGRAREVRSLELVRFPGGQVAADGTAIALLAPPYASNHPADGGRNVMFVLEDESIPAGLEQTVRDAVGAMLDNLSGREAVSLLVISKGRFEVGSTMQHDTVRAALGKFVGRAAQQETAEDASCRTQQVLSALKGVVESPAGGTSTTIVVLSGGLVPSGIGGGKLQFSNSSGGCEIRQEQFSAISTAAAKTFVDLYAVLLPTDVRGTAPAAIGAVSRTGTAGVSGDAMAGVENLAGVTGNAVIRLSGNLKAEMARVARQTSTYYLVSFEPDAGDRTGSAFRVEIRVSRENAKVRARSEVTIPKSAGASPDAKAPSARDMLRVATVYRDLSIRAVAFAGRGPGDKDLKLAVMFEPFEVGLPFVSAAAGLFDDKGKLVAQWTAQPADLGALPVMAGFPTVKPGTYRMRVAATDGSGRGGTVDQNVTVELEKGDSPVQMSALILGTPLGQQGFGPRLLYETETKAMGYFEVYGVPTAAKVTASIEIAASASGPAVATAPTGVGAPGSDGHRVVLGEIPIGSLRPGDHLVRVVVSVDGKPVGRVVRTLRKAGR